MNLQEVQQYIISRDVCVDIALMEEYPGWVRKVKFYPGNRAGVEFGGYEKDEEAYRYMGHFDTLDSAILSIEEYLQRPIHQWINYTKTGLYPPKAFNDSDIVRGSIRILEDVMHEKTILPSKGNFKLLSAKPTPKVYKRWIEILNAQNEIK